MVNVKKPLEALASALLAAMEFRQYPEELLQEALNDIQEIAAQPEKLQAVENCPILYYISNTLYNLKSTGSLTLAPETVTWLTSVWKNFISRAMTYQKRFPFIDTYRIVLKPYFPGEGTIITQINNAHQITEDFIKTDEGREKLKEIEAFLSSLSEIVNWMKPTYFFMADYYTEEKTDNVASTRKRLGNFGTIPYTYLDLTMLELQSLAILEAVYLILKKKEQGKNLVTIDGKQKLLSPGEVYTIYREKFTQVKKEVTSLKQE